MTTREHILNLTPEELTERLVAMRMPKFRTTQIHEWIFQKRAANFEEMSNLSKLDRQLLAEKFDIFTSTIKRDLTAPDGTRKLLLEWPLHGKSRRRRQGEEETGGSEEVAHELPLLPVSPSPVPESALTETVMIPCDDDHADEYGNTILTSRRTACLSTQVGCPVGCAFCASGLEGLKGNLTTGQVVEEAAAG